MHVVDVYVRSLPWLDRPRWKSILRNKVGKPWLEDEPERKKDLLHWLPLWHPGCGWHRDEELWLLVEECCEDTMLLANYMEQHLEAFKIIYAPSFDVNAMD